MLVAKQSPEAISLAVEILRAGGLIAFPTETVYGLGADARNTEAINRIFEAKGRPKSNPLIVHIRDLGQVHEWASTFPESASKLAAAFWPGPLTIIVPRSPQVSDAITANSNTVGLRIPRHACALDLLQLFGSAIAAPSANRFSAVSPTTAAHVAKDLGDSVDLILDGGHCDVGIESTIIDLSTDTPRILRPGGISREAIELVLDFGIATNMSSKSATPSPGQAPIHYSPTARMMIETASRIWLTAARLAESGAKVRVFSFCGPPSVPNSHQSFTADSRTTDCGPIVVPCSSESNLDEVQMDRCQLDWWRMPDDLNDVARQLYQRLREADAASVNYIIAELPDEVGLGLALADRLRRAAGGASFT